MSLYGMENFAYANVSAPFGTGDTSFSLAVGNTARFTTFPCMAVLWNLTDWATPHEAYFEPATPEAEIIEIVSKSGDTFNVVKRGQDGTSAIATISGKTYRIGVIASRSQWLKVCRAQPDAAGPFDAILAGTPGAVTDAIARFVKDLGTGSHGAALSVQGRNSSGSTESLLLGDTAAPTDFSLTRTQSATRTLVMLFNALNIMRVESNGAIAFNKSTIDEASPSVQFGEIVGFDKLYGGSITGPTISGGVATVTSNFVRFVSETGTTDDLDTINATSYTGTRILLVVERSGSHSITLKDGTGNLNLAAGDFTIDTSSKRIMLVSVGTPINSWVELLRRS